MEIKIKKDIEGRVRRMTSEKNMSTIIELIDCFWKSCYETCEGNEKRGLIALCEKHLVYSEVNDKIIIEIDCRAINRNQVRNIISFWKNGTCYFERIVRMCDSKIMKKCNLNWEFKIILPNDFNYN